MRLAVIAPLLSLQGCDVSSRVPQDPPAFREALTANRCTAPDWAGEGTVWGTVLGTDSAPLEGVQIWVSSNPSCGVLSDRNGEYTYHGVPDGEHSLTFQLIGYRLDSVRINLRGDTTYVPIVMEEMLIPLDDLVVTGVPDSTLRDVIDTADARR